MLKLRELLIEIPFGKENVYFNNGTIYLSGHINYKDDLRCGSVNANLLMSDLLQIEEDCTLPVFESANNKIGLVTLNFSKHGIAWAIQCNSLSREQSEIMKLVVIDRYLLTIVLKLESVEVQESANDYPRVTKGIPVDINLSYPIVAFTNSIIDKRKQKPWDKSIDALKQLSE